MKENKIKLIVFIVMLLLCTNAYPQGDGPGEPCIDDPNCQYDELPIDDGVVFLLIAGVVFGIYKIKKPKFSRPKV